MKWMNNESLFPLALAMFSALMGGCAAAERPASTARTESTVSMVSMVSTESVVVETRSGVAEELAAGKELYYRGLEAEPAATGKARSIFASLRG